jgi:ATP-binding cassette subfamily B protein/subfamily B ATP-binding cassette protein MsbA
MSITAALPRLDCRSVLGAPRRALRQWTLWLHTAGRIAPYLRPHLGQFGLALALGAGYTAVGLAEPWTMKLLLDNVLLQHPLPEFLRRLLGALATDRIRLLYLVIVLVVLFAAVRGLLYYYQQLLAARVGQYATAAMRLALYTNLQRLSFAFHDRRRTGDVLTRLTSDIRLLRDLFVSLPLSLTSELLLIVGMVLVMGLMDWRLTLLALTIVPILAVMLRLYRRPMRAAIRRQREREGDIASIAAEALGAIRVVQGFRREQHEIDRFSVENKRSIHTGLKAARLEARFRWHAEITVAVVTALVLAVATHRVLAGALSPGELIVFVAYLRTFNRPLRRVSRMAERSARGVAAGERVFELLAEEPDVKDRPGALRAPRFRGAIAFDDVSFSHRRVSALRGVSLTVDPGERIAIVGPTGAGKTTLASLIPRFYDPTVGRVLLDGRDVREYRLASIRDRVSLVFQEPVLFATSVAENIAYGKPGASTDDIVRAATLAGLHPIISGLAERYDTGLGERGARLSGGERQCVAIARAAIRETPIVILDEPLTGLDSRSADLVLRALRGLMQGRTVIMISHHLACLREMDRIVVLDRGRVVEEGAYADLVRRGGLFTELMQLQTGQVA